MDYYSQFPAPSYEECKKETITFVHSKYKDFEMDDEIFDSITDFPAGDGDVFEEVVGKFGINKIRSHRVLTALKEKTPRENV